MPESEAPKPEEILKEILSALQSNALETRLNGIAQLHAIHYSSEAIRNELEKLALRDPDRDVRKAALSALDLATQRNVRGRLSKMDRGKRQIILQEIRDWEKLGLLEKDNADVIRRRYDFDLTPAAPQPAASVETPEQIPAPAADPQPQATLTQTLLSETSIKIALYLGAFFVIASAAIFAALYEIARLPILVISAILFGGFAILIRRRLPQPSFTIFIVFSFLLPITANVLEEALNLSPPFSAAYWVCVCLFMALIWIGSAWLYESRVFSVTAFAALAVAFYRVGDIFGAAIEFQPAMLGLAALTGLPGVWALKRWRGLPFALPLFIAAQLLQLIALGASASIYIAQFMIMEPSAPLWNLAALFAWGFAFVFYLFSDLLLPFILFPWFAAATLISIPWLIGAAFELSALGAAILFFIWGSLLAAVGETLHWFEKLRKYSLPVLLVSMITAATAIVNGFMKNETAGFVCALGVAALYAALHIIRPRRWVWAFALLDFVIAYFAFFTLPVIQTAGVFFGYQALGLSILFLLPDIFVKSDAPEWISARAAPAVMRIYGALFTVWGLAFCITLGEEALNTAVVFGAYTLFFTVYTIIKRKAIHGYLPAMYLPLTILFALDHLDVDAWLPALTGLAALYFISGAIARSYENWSRMLRNSALALGALTTLGALILMKEHGGWYALVIGLLFAADMYLSRNGRIEIGIPILFNIGAFLILKDFKADEVTQRLLAYSLVWLLTDLIAHLTFTRPRPLMWITRGIGAAVTLVNYAILFFHADARISVIGFGVYALLFMSVNLAYRKPYLLYTFTLTFPLFVVFLLRDFEITKWIHSVIVIALGYYASGFLLRAIKRASGWETPLLFSGLGLGMIVSLGALILGGLDAAIPIALAATLWAVEAFARKNAWLGFPANGLYLLAYFVILVELNVEQTQFFSIGAALLGMIQHYLLTRAESKAGAFIMGMVSQLALLGTTYIQMANTEHLGYFFVLFFQALAVIVYGVVTRSRSLVFTPIAILALGLFTVLYSALKGISAVILVGCSGVLLLMLGILAVVMRERITKISEKLSDWKA
jgi:hypothetical protein